MRRNTVAINNVLKKEITKLNSQSAQYKKKSTNIILKNKKRKTMWKNTVAIHNIVKEKKLQSGIFNQLNI